MVYGSNIENSYGLVGYGKHCVFCWPCDEDGHLLKMTFDLLVEGQKKQFKKKMKEAE